MNGIDFISGIAAAAFAGSGLFFLKFWKSSGDPFYFKFCFACWLIALERIVLLSLRDAQSSIRSPVIEAHSWVYIIRLLAFVLILLAILDKNRKKG